MRLHAHRALVALLAFAASLIVPPAVAQPRPEVVVFAAASLKNALDEAMAAYRAKTGKTAVASYSHAAGLAKQIEQGAPADLSISADVDWMEYLEQRDLIDRTTRVDLLGNTLVLIAALEDTTQLRLTVGADLAGAAGAERIAVCTIASCPGGKYAKAALTALGIWQATAPKLVDQETIRVALAALARGEAKFAIVYATDAAIEPRVRVVDTFPTGSHPPIVYPAAVTRQSAHPGARDLLAYLRGPEGSGIFRKHGFSVVTE